MLFAQLVESLFLLQTVHQIKIDIWCDNIFLKLCLMLTDQRHITVTTSDEHNLFVFMLFCKSIDCLKKIIVCINLRIRMIFDDLTSVTRSCCKLSKYICLHLILLIKCAGNTVSIDISTKQYRNKFSVFKFHCLKKLLSIPLYFYISSHYTPGIL